MADLTRWFLVNGGDETLAALHTTTRQTRFSRAFAVGEGVGAKALQIGASVNARAKSWASTCRAAVVAVLFGVSALWKPTVYQRIKTERDPNARCPSCGGRQLYTDYYDQCYGCGRNIGC